MEGVWWERRVLGVWVYILLDEEGKSFYATVVKAGSLCLFLDFVGANWHKFTNIFASFFMV